MPLKWKCVDSSFLVLKNETPDNEETGVSGMDEQSQIPIFVEQQCCEVTRLTECDTKNGISVGELSGYTVNTDTYKSMPTTQSLPPDAEQTKQHTTDEPEEDEQSQIPVIVEQPCSEVTGLTECDTKNGISLGELSGCTVSSETYKSMPSTPPDEEQTKQHIKDEPEKDTFEYYRVNDTEEYVVRKCEIIDDMDSCNNDRQRQESNKCIKCDRCFDSLSDLKKHLMDCHADMTNYACLLCGKSASTSSDLRFHMLVHIDEKPHQCTKCDRCFKRLGGLKRHMRTHTGERPYSCSKCGKSFSTHSGLNQHKKIHTVKKSYSCTKCDKSFEYSVSLKLHMMHHTDENPHRCSECGETFEVLFKLKQHMLVHTDGKLYSCTKCDESFESLFTLKDHMSIHT